MKLSKLLILLATLLSFNAKAQFNPPCVDSSQINPFQPCYDRGFTPVCACDGKIYFNECAAINYGGIWNTGFQGLERCEANTYFMAPTYPQDNIRFYFYNRVSFSGFIQIFDVYGKIWYQQNIQINNPVVFNMDYTIDVSSLNPGIYFLVLVGNTPYKVTRFVKTPYG